MAKLVETMTYNAFIALGVIIGGSLIGSLGYVLAGQPPGPSMVELAEKLKIWAFMTGLGGTYETIRAMEAGFLGLQVNTLIKQLLLIFAAFIGAHTGYLLIIHLTGGKIR